MRTIFQSPKRTLLSLLLVGAAGYAVLLTVPHILQITHDVQPGASGVVVVLLSIVQIIAVAAITLGGGTGIIYGIYLWVKRIRRNIAIAQSSPPMTEIEHALWSQRIKLLTKFFWISICILVFSSINTFLVFWLIEMVQEQSSDYISIRIFDDLGNVLKLLILHLAFFGFLIMDALSFAMAVIVGIVRSIQKAKGVRKNTSNT